MQNCPLFKQILNNLNILLRHEVENIFKNNQRESNDYTVDDIRTAVKSIFPTESLEDYSLPFQNVPENDWSFEHVFTKTDEDGGT